MSINLSMISGDFYNNGNTLL